MSTKLSKDQPNTQTRILKTRIRTDIATHRGIRLRSLRKITGMVTAPFGKICNVGRTTISSWEQGINPLTERGAKKVIHGVRTEGIHCTALWLLHGIGEPPKIIDQDKLSKLNYHTAHTPMHPVVKELPENYYESDLAKEIALFKASYSENLIHQITDNTMHPCYRPRDWVGGIILPQEALELAHDMDCIVQLKNGIILARRVKIELLGALKLSLYGTNAASAIEYPPHRYLTIAQINALAPIIRIWRHNLQNTEQRE
jgi:DNA-binding transcriptional regulator YiaG